MAACAEEVGAGVGFLAATVRVVSAKPRIQLILAAREPRSVVLLLLAQGVDLAMFAEVIPGIVTLRSAALRCKATITGNRQVSTADEGYRVVLVASAARVYLPSETERLGAIVTAGGTAPGVVSTGTRLNVPSTAQVRSESVSVVSAFWSYLSLETEI